MSPPLRHRADSPESGLELLAKIAHVQAQINVFERTQQQSRQQQEPQRVGHGAQVQEAPRDSNAVAADGVVPAIDEDDTTTSSPAAAVSSRPGYLPSTARSVRLQLFLIILSFPKILSLVKLAIFHLLC